MDEVLLILKVFSFALVIDVMWVLYILTVSKNKRFLASIVSMMMGAPAIFGYLEIVNNVMMSIPYLIGLGVGTLVGLKLHDVLSKNEK